MCRRFAGAIGLFTLLAGGVVACGTDAPADVVEAGRTALPQRMQTAPVQLRVEVPPPPFTEGVFPCTECHTEADLPTNKTRRQLVDAHDDIVLKHDEEQRWCLDCHDAANRDRLHLASGELVTFDESYRVCGQCHGEKYRDWRAGAHGRRVGQWNGTKEYLLCVHCHSPHQPRFKALAPRPAPLRPVRSSR
jgi:Cytochrome c7 and related cytochrome c